MLIGGIYMQKGYKRTNKGIAVLYFFFGLIALAILVGVGYFFLAHFDYSDKLANPDASMRPYVEMTADPESSVAAADPVIEIEPVVQSKPVAATDAPIPAGTPENYVDVSVTQAPTPTPTAVPTPTPTAQPTPIPTPTPVPTPTPTPTPEPTRIASSKYASAKKSGFNVPEPSSNAEAALTNFYVSAPNENRAIQFNGYCYIDEAGFDGQGTQVFMVVTQQESGKQVAYKATMKEGVSGADHSAAKCQNAAKTDFQLFINTKSYDDGNYRLGLVLYYKTEGGTVYSYHELPETFAVSGGAVLVDDSVFGASEFDAVNAAAAG